MVSNAEEVFWSRACLRIMDVPEMHDEIIENLGQGTFHHKAGDIRLTVPLRRWKNNIWCIEAPVPKNMEIHHHLKWVSDFALKNESYLKSLKARDARIDIYMSYACDEDHRGFGLDPELLEVFVRLGIRFEMSVLT